MNQGPGVGHRMGPDCYQSGTWCRTTDRARLLSIRDLVWDSKWGQTAINQGPGLGQQVGPICWFMREWCWVPLGCIHLRPVPQHLLTPAPGPSLRLQLTSSPGKQRRGEEVRGHSHPPCFSVLGPPHTRASASVG